MLLCMLTKTTTKFKQKREALPYIFYLHFQNLSADLCGEILHCPQLASFCMKLLEKNKNAALEFKSSAKRY